MKGRNSIQAFSLIELMVVIAIISLLAAIAIPSYKQYNNRARMTEAIGLVQRQLDYYAEQTTLGNATPASISSPDNYIQLISFSSSAPNVSVTLSSANLSMLTGNTVLNYTANFTSTTQRTDLTWSCTYSSTVNLANYLPSNCTCSGGCS